MYTYMTPTPTLTHACIHVTHTRHTGVYRTHIHTDIHYYLNTIDIHYYLNTIYNSVSHPHTFTKMHVPILPHRPQTGWGCKLPESLGYRLCGRFGSVIDKFPSSLEAAAIEEVGAVFPSKEFSHQWKGSWARTDKKPKRKNQSGVGDMLPDKNKRLLLPLKTKEPMVSCLLTGHTYTTARTKLGRRRPGCVSPE